MDSRIRRTAESGVFLAAAMVLSYLETFIPAPFGIPGIKPGLANSVVLILLMRRGVADAATVSLLRVFLSALLFGNAFSLAYSLAGAVLSLAVMALLLKLDVFNTVGVSISGAVSHNAGQIAVAVIVLASKGILYYLPVLVISGILAGILVGILVSIVYKRIRL